MENGQSGPKAQHHRLHALLILCAVSAGLMVLGCPKKKGAGAEDASAEASASAADAAEGTEGGATAAGATGGDAVNVNQIARYGDETKIDNEAAKLVQGVAARKFPNGDYITTLKPGTDVTKLASRQDAFLVTFMNPKTPTEKMMGWISASGFKALPDAGPPSHVSCKADKDCAKPQVCVLTGPGLSIEQCALGCATGTCPAGQSCEGEASYGGTFYPYCTPKRTLADAGVDSGAVVSATYKVGDKVTVEWNGKWYPAAVIAVPGKDLYRIHYDNYASSWDENVGPARIKKR